MQFSNFGVPVLVRADGKAEVLSPVPLVSKGDTTYNEEWLQRLLYLHPQALPIAEIDAPLIPLCMEMDTASGPIDAVYVTPTGRLALLEAKLWRNPEARRKVIGQILDYAKELPKWDYSRLDAAVRQARKNTGASYAEEFEGIAELVAKTAPKLVAHQFQDAVTKSLAKGDYLLLIAGDGIREGVGAIAEFLDRNGSLHFTFGLIECAVYEAPGGGHYVHPRVLAKTTNIVRTVFQLSGGQLTEPEEAAEEAAADEINPELIERRAKYEKFWEGFLPLLRVEASQLVPKAARSTNQYFMMPKGSAGWISAYLAQSVGEAGVYLRFFHKEHGVRVYAELFRARDEINKALGLSVDWREKKDQNFIIIVRRFRGELLTDSREEVQKWLADCTERFISVFRPRIEQILSEQE
jgi:hypothetical protein